MFEWLYDKLKCLVHVLWTKKPMDGGHYHGGKARLGYHLVLGPLFCKWPHLGAKLAHNPLYQSSQCVTLCECNLVDLHAHLTKKINTCKIKGVVCKFFCKNTHANIHKNISFIKTTIQFTQQNGEFFIKMLNRFHITSNIIEDNFINNYLHACSNVKSIACLLLYPTMSIGCIWLYYKPYIYIYIYKELHYFLGGFVGKSTFYFSHLIDFCIH
jgi:hypothetical protein